MNLIHTVIDSPLGPLTLVADRDAAALVEVRFPHPRSGVSNVANVRRSPYQNGGGDRSEPTLARAAEQLDAYFAGARTEFDVPLAPSGTPFQLAAWDVLRAIPFGETISYGDQARRLGDAKKSRAVGAANGRNPIPIIVPCHRVVASNGHLTGFGGGIEAKAWLLDHEQAVAANR